MRLFLFVPLCFCLLMGCSSPVDDVNAPKPRKERASGSETGSSQNGEEVVSQDKNINHTIGNSLATDAIALRRPAPSGAVASGLKAPESGVGEYANPGWKLPEDGGDVHEGPAPGSDIVPTTRKPRQEYLKEEARVIEELPMVDDTRVVEELPR